MLIEWDPCVTVAKYSPRQVREARDWLAGYAGWGRWQKLSASLLERLFPEPEDGIAAVTGNSFTQAGMANMRLVIAGHADALSFATSPVLVGVGVDSLPNPEGLLPYGSLAPELGESPHATYYQKLDAGFPATGDGSVRFQVTVPEGQASFAWNEWCLAVAPELHMPSGPYLHQAAPGAIMVNRKVTSLGEKDPEASWVFNCGLAV